VSREPYIFESDEEQDEYERICTAAGFAADLLAVNDREEFVEGIYLIVSEANRRSVENADAGLLAAAAAVRVAHRAVAKLTTRQKLQLWVALAHSKGHSDWGPFKQFNWMLLGRLPEVAPDSLVPSLIDAIDKAFGYLIGRSPHTPSVKKGKPRGAKAQWVIHAFVANLWALCGPNVTLSECKSGGEAAGTIVALLGILKPVLPKQFFPRILNHSFLRKVQKSMPWYLEYLAATAPKPVPPPPPR
jgi:hypothetical protein